MKRTIISALLIIAAAVVIFAQEVKPNPNPPVKSVVETLRAAGNFRTFLSLLEKARFFPSGDAVREARSFPTGCGGAVREPTTIAGISDGTSREPTTIFAPNDAAFAKLPPGALEALKKDPARLRSFLLAHMVPGKVMVKDMFEPVENSKKEFKTTQGFVLGFSCDGRHAGMHNPTINGKARVGKFQDVMASDYLIVIHEIDAVLFLGGI